MPRSILMHDVDDATAAWIELGAQQQGVRFKAVARQLLHQAVRWEHRWRGQWRICHDLDTLAETWREEEVRVFLHTIAAIAHVEALVWP